jgi:ceramide glucosyltransferase
LRTALILALVIVAGTCGDMLVSTAMKRIGEVRNFSPRGLWRVCLQVIRSPIFWPGMLLLIASFCSFLALLTLVPVSFAVPASALGYVVGGFAAKFILHERISAARWTGLLLICVGVAITSYSEIGGRITLHLPWEIFRWIVLLIALFPFGYYIVLLWTARKFFIRRRLMPPGAADFTPPVSILKPVHGFDRMAYENYSSYCDLDYPDYEVVFLAQDENDEAIPVIQQVMADFPNCNIRLLAGVEELGPSNKVCKMIRLVREARYDLIAVSDSDIRVEKDYLRVVVENFRDPAVGAVTFLFHGLDDGSIATYLECLGASVEFCGGAIIADTLEGTQFAHGATMATTKAVLREIGGFEALVDLHADDFEFGNRIFSRGYHVRLARKPVMMVYGPETLGQYLRHELRWAIGLRNIRPGGHAGLLLTQGLTLSLLALLVAPSWTIGAAYVLAYFVLRFASAWTTAVWGLHDSIVRRKIWLLPLRDFLAFPVLVASFFTNRIQWRGIEFTIREGRLIPVGERSTRA